MTEWEIKEHPDFFKDLDKLGTRDLTTFYSKKKKIKENPLRQEHLSGGANCYREPITDNIRLVYYIKGDTIWLLTVGKHKEAFKTYLKRLYSLREKLNP
ncbi:hypothetical protein HYX06_03170 [Candidatus Woesearchaeota archaeon]|nr:hypothetical protein [Candidatus Woesearchaeota archaeon]